MLSAETRQDAATVGVLTVVTPLATPSPTIRDRDYPKNSKIVTCIISHFNITTRKKRTRTTTPQSKMARIAADGSFRPIASRNGQASRNLSVLDSLRQQWRVAPAWKRVVLIVFGAWSLQQVLNPDPLAWNQIPAVSRNPDEHYEYLKKQEGLIRRLASHFSSTIGKPKKRYDGLHYMDYGVFDGHTAEPEAFGDMESMRGTRCATTLYALSAYFCGAEVARNQDHDLGDEKKDSIQGVESFQEWLRCRYDQGAKHGVHRRSVYRLHIHNSLHNNAYAHAFAIVAQPDGTFYWLQSFIGHYSIHSWMDRKGPNHESIPLAHMDLDTILNKLDKVQRVMNITSWSFQANSDYEELFGVNKQAEALMKGQSKLDWQLYRDILTEFTWDEACEYPIPTTTENNIVAKDDTSKNDDEACSTRIRPILFPTTPRWPDFLSATPDLCF